MKGKDGQEYGPVTRPELEDWVRSGRLDSECQLLEDGSKQWRWADDVFPELKAGAAVPAPAPVPVPASVPAPLKSTSSPAAFLSGFSVPAATTEENPFAKINIGPPQRSPSAEINPFSAPQATAPAPAYSTETTDFGASVKAAELAKSIATWSMVLAVLAFLVTAVLFTGVLFVLIVAAISSGRANAERFALILPIVFQLVPIAFWMTVGVLLYSMSRQASLLARVRTSGCVDRLLGAVHNFVKTVAMMILGFFALILGMFLLLFIISAIVGLAR